MKDFDAERVEGRVYDIEERTFVLGGERFVRRVAVPPEAMFEFEDMPEGVSSQLAVEIADRTILHFLEEADHERYKAMRANLDDPVTVKDLTAVLLWLIAESTGRPTAAPSLSTAGREALKAGTPLTEESRSLVEAATG